MLRESYQTFSAQSNPQSGIQARVGQLLHHLEQGTADRVYVALQLAKYAAHELQLIPLVRSLADQQTGADRARILARLAPPSPASPDNPAPAETHRWNTHYLARVRGTAIDPDDETPLEVRVDPELGRLAIGLDLVAEFRLWCLARHHFGQPGWVDRRRLYATLQADRVRHGRRHYNRLLRRGQGLFWNVSAEGIVYLRSYRKVAAQLAEQALRGNPDLVRTNYPGVRAVYVPVDGDLKHFKAWLYAGWLTYRENPKIARQTLATLFGCTADSLRHWEKLLRRTIEVIPSYAQTAVNPLDDDRLLDYLPHHAYSYLTQRHEVRLRWRQSNVYRTHLVRQHPHKGQSRKARVAAAKVIRATRPAENRAGNRSERALAFGRDHWVVRRYFANVDAWRRFLKREARQGRRVEEVVSPETPRYVFRGMDRHGHAIYELALNGELETGAWERTSIKKEYVWRRGEERHRQHWRERVIGG